MRIHRPNLVWCPAADTALHDALAGVLADWEGTPYESGQRFKGRGADCLGAVFGVIDDLDGRQRAAFPDMPHDTALHDRQTALVAMRRLLERYQPSERVDTPYVEPGDVLVTGSPGGGPGHVALIGPRKNELWHSLPHVGFHRTGWGLLQQQRLHAVYRFTDRERWYG